ncbi:hypothetical protein [Chryseobacterium sp.]|uniref:hypothetical protein n=1 Tax=Chryseobacterium sp. TaxID=1871047 RepID=UPI00321AA678
MKNKFKTLLAVGFLSIATVSYAQVRIVNSASNAGVGNMTAFIDASSNSTANGQPNVGKGLLFPRTDLTTLTAFGGGPTGAPTSFPTRYDGMIVYNTAAAGVAGVGATQGTLSPGYWFYENKTTNVNGGTWKPLGALPNPKLNILTTETVTNTLVNNAQVYAIKGTFNASGTSTAVDIPAPAGMTAMYGITIYKAGTNTVYDRSLYSYTVATTAGNAVTGSPNMSVVYPNGTYEYVLEYLK